MDNRTEAEIAWAAGLFEGEGSFCVNRRNGNRPRATMSMTDLDVMERFLEIVGVGKISKIGRKQKGHHKDAWQWWTTEEEFHAVFNLLKEWLHPRRVEAAETAIAMRKNYVDSRTKNLTCALCGSPYTGKHQKGGPSKYCSDECRRYRPSKPSKAQMALVRAVAQPQPVTIPEE